MPNSTRGELLGLITRIGELAPDFRLGQLITLLTDRAETGYTLSPIADIEDEELLGAARAFLEALEARQSTESNASALTLRDRFEWMIGAAPDLPADLYTEHIHGTPRRSEESKAS